MRNSLAAACIALTPSHASSNETILGGIDCLSAMHEMINPKTNFSYWGVSDKFVEMIKQIDERNCKSLNLKTDFEFLSDLDFFIIFLNGWKEIAKFPATEGLSENYNRILSASSEEPLTLFVNRRPNGSPFYVVGINLKNTKENFVSGAALVMAYRVMMIRDWTDKKRTNLFRVDDLRKQLSVPKLLR